MVLGVNAQHFRVAVAGTIIGIYVAAAAPRAPLMVVENSNMGGTSRFVSFVAGKPANASLFDVPPQCMAAQPSPAASAPVVSSRRHHTQTLPALAAARRLITSHDAKSKGYSLRLNGLARYSFYELQRSYLMPPTQAPLTQLGNFSRLAASSREPLPAAYDSRDQGFLTPVRNQGFCGSCWSFSTTACLEVVLAKQKGAAIPHLAPQFFVNCAPPSMDGVAAVIASKGCFGGWPATAAKFAQVSHGVPTEADMPYAGVDGQCDAAKASPYAGWGGYQISSALLPPSNVSAMQHAILSNGAIVATIQVLQDFVFYDSGVYSNKACTGAQLSHAVVIVGWGATVDGTEYWTIKNSFGKAWGEAGYVRMARGDNMCGIEKNYPLAIVVNKIKTDDVGAGKPPPPKYMPVGPPMRLPQLNGAAFPGFRPVFQNGECDADDPGGPGAHPINLKKRCFSCFRIPSVTVNRVTGTLHAFAEARRGDLGDLPAFHGMIGHTPVLCPDVPDTTVAYKRSTDGGSSWSPLKILHWVEGRTRGQPTPVVGNTTGVIFMAFGDIEFGGKKSSAQMLMTISKDDGKSWTNATAARKVGGGSWGKVNPNSGLGRGFVIYDASLPSKTRLLLPTESGSLYSDDHGASWTLGPPPEGQTYVGENSIARCTPGACGGAPGGSAKFAMVHRGAGGAKGAAGIHFSNDSIHWSPQVQLPSLSTWSNYSQAPGLIAVPGGLLMSHGGKGASTGRQLGHGDGNGIDILLVDRRHRVASRSARLAVHRRLHHHDRDHGRRGRRGQDLRAARRGRRRRGC